MGGLYFHRAVVEEDLRLIGRQDIPAIFKKLRLLRENVDAGQPLGDELSTFRKLIVGKKTYRIVYRVADRVVEICEIWAVGHRRNDEVYDRAAVRVRQASKNQPELVPVAELLERLKELEGVEVGMKPDEVKDPVPEWLYEKLVHVAEVPTHEVAAMTGAAAFELWNEWMCRKL